MALVVSKVLKKLNEYLESSRSGIPILRECCLINNWDFDEFVEFASSNDKVLRAANMIISQKIVNLEKMSINGDINKQMAIYLHETAENALKNNSKLTKLQGIEAMLSQDILDSAGFSEYGYSENE